MTPPNACEYWAKKRPKSYKVVGKIEIEAGRRACRMDYENKDFISSMESIVDCEERCYEEPYMNEDYEEDDVPIKHGAKDENECVKDCHDMIKEYGKGSIIYKESGEVLDANMPLTSAPFRTEDKYGDNTLEIGWEKKVLDKFYNIGCDPDPDVGFRHPHEFAATTAGSEPEEDPEAMAIHIRSSSKGRCMLDDVFELLGKL